MKFSHKLKLINSPKLIDKDLPPLIFKYIIDLFVIFLMVQMEPNFDTKGSTKFLCT